jgi:5-hydroxyisourate hydrolase
MTEDRTIATLSTHVLDSSTGTPAADVTIGLERARRVTVPSPTGSARSWERVGGGVTDPDGRLRDWGDVTVGPGEYRLVFATGDWFAAAGRECFHPEITISFTVRDDGSHHHVPLLLAPYAYTTYRGS